MNDWRGNTNSIWSFGFWCVSQFIDPSKSKCYVCFLLILAGCSTAGMCVVKIAGETKFQHIDVRPFSRHTSSGYIWTIQHHIVKWHSAQRKCGRNKQSDKNARILPTRIDYFCVRQCIYYICVNMWTCVCVCADKGNGCCARSKCINVKVYLDSSAAALTTKKGR